MGPTPGRLGLALLTVACVFAIPTVSAEGSPEDPPVIAYEDTGINPYHEEFRAPAWTEHPSTYIDGYPEDAEPLNLTLDADTFEEAWEADREDWEGIEAEQLYYVPGTRIVGAIAHNLPSGSRTPIYDDADSGHGTLVASVGSGNTLGTAPNSAIVMTTGGSVPSMTWIQEEPWIDLSSISRGSIVGLRFDVAEASHAVVQEGRTIFNAGGNGPPSSPGTNIDGDRRGPPWVVQVGAADPTDQGGAPGTHVPANYDRPIEVLGRVDVPAAATDSMDETRTGLGTSTATPRVAGHAANLIDAARERLDDVSHPPTSPTDAYAQAPPGVALPDRGPLADGTFDRADLETLIRQAARPLPWAMPGESFDALTFGLSPLDIPREMGQPAEARYTWQGYGLHNDTANDRAEAILLGDEPWPDRPTDDRWHRFWESAREAYWATALCPQQTFRESYEGNCWMDPSQRFAQATVGVVEGAAG